MSLQLHWFLPTHGDGREVAKPSSGPAVPGARREPDLDYLTQVALAVERFGLHGMLVPFGLFCEDPWIVAAALAGRTRRVNFMVATRPGLMSPVLAAQSAATLQRVSGGRLQLNVVTGGDADEQRRYGDWLDHDQRYERTGEFLEVFRRAWSGDRFDFTGAHHQVAGGLLTRPYAGRPLTFVGGSSAAAQRVAAQHADVFLVWGESPPAIAGLISSAGGLAEAAGRELAYGSRFHVISRDTSAEAWRTARRLVDGMDPARIRQAQQRFARSESEGQRRMAALHNGHTDALEIYPNVWAGYGLVRPGVGTALVGSHEEVADRIKEYAALGIEEFILSGYPHLEEAYWFGESVLPRLEREGLWVNPAEPSRAVKNAVPFAV